LSRNGALNGVDDISPAGMSDDPPRRIGTHFIKLRDGLCGEIGDFAVELVFEASTGIDEADFFPVLGLVDGSEILETQLTVFVF
jgi:hypothetical protein